MPDAYTVVYDDSDYRNATRPAVVYHPPATSVPPRATLAPAISGGAASVASPGAQWTFQNGQWTTAPAAPQYAAPPQYPAYYQIPAPASPPPAVSPFTGTLRWGVLADAAAQVFTALTPLPQPPVLDVQSGDSSRVQANLAKMVEYQKALAEHSQKQSQIRTIGAVVRAFLP